jgi:hypothetical protein
MIYLGTAMQMLGVLPNRLQEIVEQGGACNDLSAMWVNEAMLKPIALCSPAVLIEKKKGIIRRAPSLTLPALQVATQAAKECSDAKAIIDKRTDISDPQFERWESRRGPEIPSDFCRVLDDPRALQLPNGFPIFAPARKAFRDAFARRRIIDRCAKRLEPSILALPERRGCR